MRVFRLTHTYPYNPIRRLSRRIRIDERRWDARGAKQRRELTITATDVDDAAARCEARWMSKMLEYEVTESDHCRVWHFSITLANAVPFRAGESTSHRCCSPLLLIRSVRGFEAVEQPSDPESQVCDGGSRIKHR